MNTDVAATIQAVVLTSDVISLFGSSHSLLTYPTRKNASIAGLYRTSWVRLTLAFGLVEQIVLNQRVVNKNFYISVMSCFQNTPG